MMSLPLSLRLALSGAFSLLLLGSVAPAQEAPKADAPAKGVIVLGTRGFTRTTRDANQKNTEAQTLFRQEFPYGAAKGWRQTYQGYSDGTDDTITIVKAGVWIRATPLAAAQRIPLTFDGGKDSLVLEKNTFKESDPIAVEVPPGAIVWATTWYRVGKPELGLPFQTFCYGKETTPGAEDHDGALQGPVGSLADQTLEGGFNHDGVGPLNAGVPYCFRGYQPMAAVGRPHPGFTGTEIVPFFIGDSINVQQNDVYARYLPDTPYTFRGFNGRFCEDKYPYVVFGQGGSTSGGFWGTVKSPLFTYILGDNGENPRKVTHLFDEYGINSRHFTPREKFAENEWAARLKTASIAREYGLPYIHSTLMPCEARWVNLPNLSEEENKAKFGTFTAQRHAFNQKVRAQSAEIPGCIGFWDPCSVLETDPAQGSNAWLPELRADGIHPGSEGHGAAAKTIPHALLRAHPNPVPAGK